MLPHREKQAFINTISEKNNRQALMKEKENLGWQKKSCISF